MDTSSKQIRINITVSTPPTSTLVHQERSGECEKEHEETRSLRSVVVAVVRKVFLLLITPKGEVLVWGPSAVFSLASLAAAFIVTLLPETKNKIMAQGIDDQPEHVVEQYDPPRPQHDPPRTQHDPLRPHPKDHEANSQVLLV
ncbi:hypothetical protein Pcinc_009575 [Petrolisthes cinctipes]|uniref:Uncharacterized protein n=1 Tax=Petrolisthes cinctipes TaxID=88211 RepID=A0AAE1G6J6_PETCI|nr:hypothetical protein Pcinc_009575 [Petrolisthes cinctipes]